MKGACVPKMSCSNRLGAHGPPERPPNIELSFISFRGRLSILRRSLPLFIDRCHRHRLSFSSPYSCDIDAPLAIHSFQFWGGRLSFSISLSCSHHTKHFLRVQILIPCRCLCVDEQNTIKTKHSPVIRYLCACICWICAWDLLHISSLLYIIICAILLYERSYKLCVRVRSCIMLRLCASLCVCVWPSAARIAFSLRRRFRKHVGTAPLSPLNSLILYFIDLVERKKRRDGCMQHAQHSSILKSCLSGRSNGIEQ